MPMNIGKSILKKIFTKPKGIKTKFIFTFLLLASIPLSIASIYGVYYSVEILEDITLRHLGYELSSKSGDIEKLLKNIHRDVLFLSRFFVISELADFKGPKGSEEFEHLRRRVESASLIFSKTHPYYYQIRYIDSNGYEMIRVDSDGRDSTIIPAARLQYKGDRYYFKEAIKYSDGLCYVSPMDFNIERGEIESPRKPVVRVATPVFDSGGRKAGIFIINLYASFLIQQMKELNISGGGTTFLVNRQGFYLSQLNSKGAENKPFELGFTEGLGKDYSTNVVSSILSGKPGMIKTSKSIMSYAPIFTGDSVSNEYWVLTIAYPNETIFAPIRKLEMIFLLIGGIAISLALAMGLWMARLFTGPVLKLHQGVGWIADGDFDRKLDIRTGDEIESLADGFNAMGEILKASREKMERWNEELTKEVEKRTRELKIEKNKIENIILSANEGIIVADEDDRIIIFNPVAESIFGVKKADMIGRDIFSCHVNLEKAKDRVIGRTVEAGQPATIDIGSSTVEIGWANINYDGEKFGSRMVLRDISETQKFHEERLTMERQLFHADKLVSIGELSAGIAHEIGNPLASIKTVIQAMDEEHPFTGEQKKYMKRILKEVSRLSVFLRTFSAYANPWVTKSAKSRVDQVLKDVIFLVRNEASKHFIGINYTVGRDIPEAAIDSDQLKQVFMNIFLNAIQAMQEGGLITASITHLNGATVKVSISDTGPGIPEGIIDKIFDPFFTTKPMGTGLGLSIVHRIIDEHNGQITVRNGTRGAVFEIFLPATDNSESASI